MEGENQPAQARPGPPDFCGEATGWPNLRNTLEGMAHRKTRSRLTGREAVLGCFRCLTTDLFQTSEKSKERGLQAVGRTWQSGDAPGAASRT